MTVQIQDLTIGVGQDGPTIVEGVSFHIEPGKIVGLVGESGSGKTTLATALLGYFRDGARVRAGRVVVAGNDVAKAGPRELARLRGRVVSYVSSDPGTALNPARRIGTQLQESCRGPQARTSESAATITQTLERVGLPCDRAFLRRYPHQLSGGQQQRVMLALAFVRSPALVVLDEPTSALDAVTQRAVLGVIRDLCTQSGASALLISHDIDVVSEVADNVIVLYAGSTAEAGTVTDVLTNPAHPYTQALLAAVPRRDLGHDVTGIRGRAPRLEERRDGCKFANRCEHADNGCRLTAPALLEADPAGRGPSAAVSAGGDVHALACHHPQTGRFHLSTTSSRAPSEAERPASSLVADQLTVSYQDHVALKGVSFEVFAGECLAIVGESGSGKTTLAQAVAGLRAPDSGRVLLDGLELAGTATGRRPDQRRQVQYVFQNPYASLNPRRTIRQILSEPVRVFGLDTPDLAGALDRVSLSGNVLDERPAALSGGERQRVAIARALVCDPAYLVCDEVTSALDVSVQATVVRLLADLRRDLGLGMLFVTHNLKLVASIADRVIVMREGLVTEEGTTVKVFEHPADSYTTTLIHDAAGSTA